jgi:hypothetical protein
MDFAACVYLSETLNPSSHTSPLLHTVYVFTVYILIHTGKGGGGRAEPERRRKEQHRRVQIPKLG